MDALSSGGIWNLEFESYCNYNKGFGVNLSLAQGSVNTWYQKGHDPKWRNWVPPFEFPAEWLGMSAIGNREPVVMRIASLRNPKSLPFLSSLHPALLASFPQWSLCPHWSRPSNSAAMAVKLQPVQVLYCPGSFLSLLIPRRMMPSCVNTSSCKSSPRFESGRLVYWSVPGVSGLWMRSLLDAGGVLRVQSRFREVQALAYQERAGFVSATSERWILLLGEVPVVAVYFGCGESEGIYLFKFWARSVRAYVRVVRVRRILGWDLTNFSLGRQLDSFVAIYEAMEKWAWNWCHKLLLVLAILRIRSWSTFWTGSVGI